MLIKLFSSKTFLLNLLQNSDKTLRQAQGEWYLNWSYQPFQVRDEPVIHFVVRLLSRSW